MSKGIFITIEGPEGSGKTSIIQMLVEDSNNIVFTREPGGVIISEKVREIILNNDHVEMDARTEALLYAAARRQHLVEKVIPALNEGTTVICDRFIDSSLAYQGHARGLGIDEVLSINQFAIDNVMPDVTILLDIDPEIGLERIANNNQRELNRLDKEKLSFHESVREGYLELSKRFPERIKVVDASRELDLVYEDVISTIFHHIT